MRLPTSLLASTTALTLLTLIGGQAAKNTITSTIEVEVEDSIITNAREEIAELCRYFQYQHDPPINMAAKFLRLAFHDSVGSPDGCVDLDDPDNAGLDIPIRAIQPIVDKYAYQHSPGHGDLFLSRSDIWMLAALTGVESNTNTKGIQFPLYYFGRKDCDYNANTTNSNNNATDENESDSEMDVDVENKETSSTVPFCQNTNGDMVTCGPSTTASPGYRLPGPDLTTDELLDFFDDAFGFTVRETVVAMGAHTFGVASRNHSGFEGSHGWVDSRDIVNNEYYGMLVGGTSLQDTLKKKLDEAPHWGAKSQDNTDLQNTDVPNRFLWTRRTQATAISSLSAATGSGQTPQLIMLTSDIALCRNLSGGYIDPVTQSVSCQFVLRNGNGNGDGSFRALASGRCPHVDGRMLNMLLEFKLNNSLWLEEFGAVLTKMFSAGYDTSPDCQSDTADGVSKCLRLVVPGVFPPTAMPTPSPFAMTVPTTNTKPTDLASEEVDVEATSNAGTMLNQPRPRHALLYLPFGIAIVSSLFHI